MNQPTAGTTSTTTFVVRFWHGGQARSHAGEVASSTWKAAGRPTSWRSAACLAFSSTSVLVRQAHAAGRPENDPCAEDG